MPYLADAMYDECWYQRTFIRCKIGQAWYLTGFDIWRALAAGYAWRCILDSTILMYTRPTRTTLHTKATKFDSEIKRKKNVLCIPPMFDAWLSKSNTHFFKQYAHESCRK